MQYPYPLLIIAGKGGVGKTVLTATLGSEAAAAGRSTLVVELGGQHQLPQLLVDDPGGLGAPDDDGVIMLDQDLGWSTLSPDRLLAGWLSGRNMGLIADRLESSGALSVVASSVPGIKDVLVLGHLRSRLETGRWEQIIVDGPASGRAREMLRTPRQLAEATEEGPIADQARRAHALLTDPERCALLLVSLAEETPVNETIETAFDVEDDPGIRLAGVVANRVFPVEPPPASLESHRAGPAIRARYERERAQVARLEAELPIPLAEIPERADGFQGPRDVLETTVGRAPGPPTDGDRFESAAATDLDAAIGRRIVVAVGTGGVGKTSVAAALAVREANAGRSVALITIDPARRLADALGLPELGDELVDIDLPDDTSGRLRATMLDPRETFGRVIRSNAHSEQQAADILASPLSSQLADALAGMTEYMAVERLYELTREPDVDLIIVDTPPSADALAFLGGPTLLTRLLDNRIYRFLVHEGRRRNIVQRAIGGLVGQLISIVGGAVINDAVKFFRLFDGMEQGFRDRSGEIHELLRSDETALVVVAAPGGRSLDNALEFSEQLEREGVEPRLAIANRCTADPGDPLGDPAADELLAHLRVRRAREQARLVRYAAEAGVPVLAIDELDEPITNLAGVSALADELDAAPSSTAAT